MEKILDNPEMLLARQKLVRATGIILFIGACGLALTRVVSALLSQYVFSSLDEVTETIVSDVIFTFLVQVVVLLIGPFLVYKLYLKGETKNFLKISNVRPVSFGVCLIAVVVGLLAPVFSMLINYCTNLLFISIGVSLPSSSTILPEKFNVWVLILNIVLTAVLPGICEEIFNRGIVLTGVRSMLPQWLTILVGGLIFGLFHQYIFQYFYTGAFGMVIVFISLKTKSIVPAMIIHFTNNLISVIGEFALFYSWDFMSLQSIIASIETTYLIPAMIVGVGAFVLAIFLLLKCDKADKHNQIIDKLVKEGKIPQEALKSKNVKAGIAVVGGPLGEVVYYKPTIKDLVFYYGALAVSLLSTLFTLFWYML